FTWFATDDIVVYFCALTAWTTKPFVSRSAHSEAAMNSAPLNRAMRHQKLRQTFFTDSAMPTAAINVRIEIRNRVWPVKFSIARMLSRSPDSAELVIQTRNTEASIATPPSATPHATNAFDRRAIGLSSSGVATVLVRSSFVAIGPPFARAAP